MGARGPKPIPTETLALRGSWQAKARVKQGVAKAPPGVPSVPDDLEGEARVEWARLCADLHVMGLLATADRTAITAHCVAWAEFLRANTERERLTPDDRRETYGKRVLDAFHTAMGAVLKSAQEFGLSPAARTRIRTMDTPKSAAGNIDDFAKSKPKVS